MVFEHTLLLWVDIGQAQVRGCIKAADREEAMERVAPVLCDTVLSLLETASTANSLR
jgi:hypothetical protein